MARALRAVTAADVAAVTPAPPKSLVEAAKDGDDLAELRAMRLVIARAVADPDTPPRDLASLSRRQIEIGREIRALEALAMQEAGGDDGPAEDADLDAASL